MAIAFDNSLSHTDWGGLNSTFSSAFTVTGSNTLLVATISFDNAGADPTVVTYNGVALTHLVTVDAGGPNVKTAYYYLLGAATGSNTFTVTFSGAISFNIAVASYTGVNQTGQPDVSTNAVNASGDFTQNVTTVANNDWIIEGAQNADTLFALVGPGTIRVSANQSNDTIIADRGPLSPAGSYGVELTWGGGTPRNSVFITVGFKPVVAGPPINIDTTQSLIQGVKIVG